MMKILTWEARTNKGLTLMELSRKTGIGKSTLNNIENEKVSPTLFQLETIAIALDMKISDLYESEYK
ncbi:MAG: helix-turn-helix transcriptional regulator [Roseburia sp.]|nr:helix-turn-helix transcriptional regulator [Roseburia sp.]